MRNVFEVVDKTGKKIRLTEEQWQHIKQKHSNVNNYEIETTVRNPIKRFFDEDDDVWLYYAYFKHKNQLSKYLRVLVKFLNGEGYVITAYFIRTLG
jgi:phosphomannomutase